MVRVASHDASPGDVVNVFDKDGKRFGSGLYNPRSTISVRMLVFDEQPIDA